MKSTHWILRRRHAEEGRRAGFGRGRAAVSAPLLVGTLVGATGGLAFVLANTHSPLNAAESVACRILAVVGLTVLVVLSVFAGKPFDGQSSPSRGRPSMDEASWFGRGFWVIIAGELALFQIGFQLLRAFGGPPQSRVAWIAVVVGLHFVALARLWREPSMALLGVVLFALGTAGLAMSATSAVDWAPVVSGVLPGFVLLAGCLAAIIAVVIQSERLQRAA